MELFPTMPLSSWRESKETFHRFTQIVGKIRLAASPRSNHWWNVPFHLTGRGLTTRPMGPTDARFCIDFDLIDHRITVDLADGRRAGFCLVGQSVASFYRQVFEILDGFGINVSIRAIPFDLADATPFADDTHHDSYDPVMITRYWQVLSQVAETLELHAREFTGKTSPVHHFWHTFDIASTRFTGRVTEDQQGDSVIREAYSREVISFGFWFGDDTHPAPMFYSYTAPEPDGLAAMPLRPEQAYWESSGAGHLALLAYDVARNTEDPVGTVLDFYDSAYHAGAQLVGLNEHAYAAPGGVSYARTQTRGRNGRGGTSMDEPERQERLRDIDNELASLREQLEQVQQPDTQPGDPADAGTDLAAREQLSTRIEDLQAERGALTNPDTQA